MNPNVNNIRNDIGPILYTLDISDLREGEGYLSDLSNLKYSTPRVRSQLLNKLS